MPRLAQPAGSEDAQEPVAIVGNLVKIGILRVLRAERQPDGRRVRKVIRDPAVTGIHELVIGASC
ncbi:hypothetical protein GCM10010460_12300 [Microbacterium terrae]|uniref:hypothetical protein n=1 Tax=Microbacterium terrae TaxID=69369 RepID=UPI000A8AFD0C|nr:hypothetical protein [Microbacterium terrae]GLJ98497.1 hypothetical protein GCM10017594_16940 [Microbacterium terrae]